MASYDKRLNNDIVKDFLNEWQIVWNDSAFSDYLLSVKQLKRCNADVYTFKMPDGTFLYVLKSYATFVAAIYENVGYDFLRYVYGYTATSAQHIAKFMNEYDAQICHRYYPL